MAAIYDGRRTDADGNATTILGYAISLATLTVTSSALLNPSKGFAIAAAVATGVSAALAVWARLGAGLHAGPRLVRSDASPGAPRLVISHKNQTGSMTRTEILRTSAQTIQSRRGLRFLSFGARVRAIFITSPNKKSDSWREPGSC